MRCPVQYVVCPWWPEGGDAWVHPDDAAMARQMIPGWRVFRVAGKEGPYRVLRYGTRVLRVQPTMWVPVRGNGLEVGQWVQIRSRLGKNRPGVGRIGEMVWNRRDRTIDYMVYRQDMLGRRKYRAEDLGRVERMPSGKTAYAFPPLPHSADFRHG